MVKRFSCIYSYISRESCSYLFRFPALQKCVRSPKEQPHNSIFHKGLRKKTVTGRRNLKKWTLMDGTGRAAAEACVANAGTDDWHCGKSTWLKSTKKGNESANLKQPSQRRNIALSGWLLLWTLDFHKTAVSSECSLDVPWKFFLPLRLNCFYVLGLRGIRRDRRQYLIK